MKVTPPYDLQTPLSHRFDHYLALVPCLSLVTGVSIFALMLLPVRPDWLPARMAWPMAILGIGLLISLNNQWRMRQQRLLRYHIDWRVWQSDIQNMAYQLEAQLDTRQRVAKNLHERVMSLLLAQVTVIRHTLNRTSASEDLHGLLDSLSCKRLVTPVPTAANPTEQPPEGHYPLQQLHQMINEEAATAQRLGLIDSVQWQTFDNRLSHQSRQHLRLLDFTDATGMPGLSLFTWGYVLLLPFTLAEPLSWLTLPVAWLTTTLLMLPQQNRGDPQIETMQVLQNVQSVLIEVLGYSPGSAPGTLQRSR